MMFSVVALATPAVLLFSPIIVELGQQRGLDERTALLSIIIGSIGSAAGRLLMPAAVGQDRSPRHRHDPVRRAGGALFRLYLRRRLVGDRRLYGADILLFRRGGGDPSHRHRPVRLQKRRGQLRAFSPWHEPGSVAFSLLANSFGGPLPRHITAIAAAAVGFAVLIFLKPTQGKRL